MSLSSLSRRRFLTIVGIGAGAALIGGRISPAVKPISWSGQAMGAQASIVLYHSDPAAAQNLLAECQREIERVEQQFSLFRRDSTLVRLNREGHVDRAPAMFRHLVQTAQSYAALSQGTFDVTVQPLWDLYAGHFSQSSADPAGPDEAAVQRAKSLVDWRGLTVEGERVAFAKPGMAATFNGIAQGFVTDVVADMLRARGITNVLLDLGEMRALGTHADGRKWHVGIGDPRQPGSLLQTVELDRAMATSGGYGTVFDAAGRFHHLFDPRTGRPWTTWLGVTVMAETATAADALTKAIALAPLEQAKAILHQGGGTKAVLVDAAGVVHMV